MCAADGGRNGGGQLIADERMMTFIHSFDSGNPPYLHELEKYAKETNVPIVRPQMQSLLKFLLTWGRPMKILEVGTAIGFSALLIVVCTAGVILQR